MPTYPIARYYFTFKVITPIRMPEYAGSTLRGVFGWALRKTACMTRMDNCSTCPLKQTCPYTSLFEPIPPTIHTLQKFSTIPSPYVIEPNIWGKRIYYPGETFSFSMVLIGRAIQQLALIAFSWQRAFAQEVAHGTAQLINIQYENDTQRKNIYDIEQKILLSHKPQLMIKKPNTSSITLSIYTPLRLQENGHALPPNKLTTRRLLVALFRRINLLQEFYMGNTLKIDTNFMIEQIKQVTGKHQLKWKDWTRYSNRQQQKMQLGGVVGKWKLEKISSSLMEYLVLGQWLHIGKNASFGLGGYILSNE